MYHTVCRIEAELIAVGSECQPRLVNARDFAHLDLQQERIVLVVISTAGDGKLQAKLLLKILITFCLKSSSSILFMSYVFCAKYFI